MLKQILALFAFCCAAFAQTPVVTEILNNYGLANSGTVAQGAIFIVKGSNLSDFTTGLQDVPLQTDLQGVRMVVTVSGVTTFAPMYYVLPQQLAGILPSASPTGAGTLVIRNNGKNSVPVAINVIRSGFGVLTVSGTGSGAARVQNASRAYQELLSTRSANPGDFLVFYGSGLGPVTGDETRLQVQVDLTSIPTTVTIGGKAATVLYRGRTAFPGLDQINVQVPTLDAATYGCSVPVVIQTNSVAANTTTIPVAQSGLDCTPAGTGSTIAPTQQELDRWTAAGSLTRGILSLARNTSYSVADNLPGVPNGTTIRRTDAFEATFQRINPSRLGGATLPSVGSCSVSSAAPTTIPFIVEALDAGPSITVSGPGGVQTATRDGLFYTARVNGSYLIPGRYTFSGSGGPAVSAFSGPLDVTSELVVSNPDDLKLIVRGAGLNVRWTGGDPAVPVQISGSSIPIGADGSQGTPVTFLCAASAADGRFTVPAAILSQLPATGSFSGAGFAVPVRGSVTVTTSGKGARLTASGVDYLTANHSWTWTVSTEFR